MEIYFLLKNFSIVWIQLEGKWQKVEDLVFSSRLHKVVCILRALTKVSSPRSLSLVPGWEREVNFTFFLSKFGLVERKKKLPIFFSPRDSFCLLFFSFCVLRTWLGNCQVVAPRNMVGVINRNMVVLFLELESYSQGNCLSLSFGYLCQWLWLFGRVVSFAHFLGRDLFCVNGIV